MRIPPPSTWLPPYLINVFGIFVVLISTMDPQYLAITAILPLVSISSHVLLYPLRKSVTYSNPRVIQIRQLFPFIFLASIPIIFLELELLFIFFIWIFFILRSFTQILYFFVYDRALRNTHYGKFFYALVFLKTSALVTAVFNPKLALIILCLSELLLLWSFWQSLDKHVPKIGLWNSIDGKWGLFLQPVCGILEALLVRFFILGLPVIPLGSYSIAAVNVLQIIETAFMRFMSRPVLMLDQMIYSFTMRLSQIRLHHTLLLFYFCCLSLCFFLLQIFSFSTELGIISAVLLFVWACLLVALSVCCYLFVDGVIYNTGNNIFLLYRFPKLLSVAFVFVI